MSPRPGQSLFEQVAAAIRAEIRTGTLRPGSDLPSEKALSETYDVGRDTVRDALRLLRDEGLVNSRLAIPRPSRESSRSWLNSMKWRSADARSTTGKTRLTVDASACPCVLPRFPHSEIESVASALIRAAEEIGPA
ncbi:winged helix-turn-helix domain-containing protein [Dactylosporangium sp. CA-233914]|uniref:winged helix-turn-helix domain-containing protein n=1 Tax=Dactylosporangium sp. CA-233914 TaxID=3239934 RepID=UPI003D8F517F